MKIHSPYFKIISVLFSMLMLLESNIAQAADTNHSIQMHTKGSATYYVSALINNTVASDFLVDTGSGYVTINIVTMQKLKVDKVEFIKKISAVMADGSEMTVPVYRLASLKLGNKCIIKNVEAAVMPGTGANILGLSALKKAAPFSMSVTPPALNLSGCKLVHNV
jgi:predicted aspartyl protease